MEIISHYKTIDGKLFNDKEKALEYEISYYEKLLTNNKTFNNIINTIPEESGIYMWTNPYDGYKKYIGSTKNLKKRYYSFIDESREYAGSKINDARKKTSPLKWQYVILEKCDILNLTERENYYINIFDSITNGYNGVIASTNVHYIYNDNRKVVTTFERNAEESWNNFLKKINKNIFLNFTKNEYINKRLKYKEKYNNAKLVYNFSLKTFNKQSKQNIIDINDIVFIPQKLSSMITPRMKYQSNGLKSGVIFSVEKGKYKSNLNNNDIWFDTEDEAYINNINILLNKINDFCDSMNLLDNDIKEIISNLTIEQLEKLIFIS